MEGNAVAKIEIPIRLNKMFGGFELFDKQDKCVLAARLPIITGWFGHRFPHADEEAKLGV